MNEPVADSTIRQPDAPLGAMLVDHIQPNCHATHRFCCGLWSLGVHLAFFSFAAFYARYALDRPAELAGRTGDGAFQVQGVVGGSSIEQVADPAMQSAILPTEPTPPAISISQRKLVVESSDASVHDLPVLPPRADASLPLRTMSEEYVPSVSHESPRITKAVSSAGTLRSDSKRGTGATHSSSGGVAGKSRPDLAGNREPIYPPEAVASRVEGTVVLQLTVAKDGSVRDVTVVKTSGSELLDNAAVEAVSQWRGTPAIVAGQAVPTVEVLPVRFELKRGRVQRASFR